MIFQYLNRATFLFGLIVVVSMSLRQNGSGALLSFGDIAIHVAGYAALALTGVFGWPRSVPMMIVALAILGLALELIQIMVPTRGFEWSDALANAAGALVGGLLAKAVARYLPVGWKT